MEMRDIRVTAITAIAADDVLMEMLVLKGGNALEIAHGIGGRASLDLDYSVEGELPQLEDVKRRLETSLKDRFGAAGHVVFDFRFNRRPSTSDDETRWGGYRAEFKLIEQSLYDRLKGNSDSVRRQASAIGPEQQRTFHIDISKYEYVKPKQLLRMNDYDYYVYTPAMIAAEKLRAVCQQLPSYPQRRHPSVRPRDFYDIVCILESGRVQPEDCGGLLAPVFAAKEVPLALLAEVNQSRDFHRGGWEAVQNAVSTKLESFDVYFDKVIEYVRVLEPWWIEDSPQ